jgi:DNA-binding beta-propeller fold protein YncE
MTRRHFFRSAPLLLALLVLATAAGLAADLVLEGVPGREGKVVVANRGAGTVSVIDVATGAVRDVPLPEGDNPPEPMYVSYGWPAGRVFVGDRANDRMVVFAAGDMSVVGTVPTGRGIFHSWNSPPKTQLWVNNDIDNTTTIIDVVTLEVLGTTPTPADLVARGGKPHDVIVDPDLPYAYVTVIGVEGPNDYVVQYSTETFAETARLAVGNDPHLSLAFGGDHLYVPCQGADAVFVFDRETLAQVEVVDIPGAHGAGMRFDGEIFYTTNLPGAGVEALWAIDTDTLEIAGTPVPSPFPVPHNIALTPDGGKLYLTHSGATSNKVTIYEVRGDDPTPQLVDEVETGSNPFGLAWVP